MNNSIHQMILHTIQDSRSGDLFGVSDFLMLGSYDAVKRALARLADAKQITRVLRGLYQKADTLPPSIYDVAFAIARQHAWTIIPAEATALHLLELEKEPPQDIVFVSDGPYRSYGYAEYHLVFKRRPTREIKPLSFQTALVCEAFKAIGEDNITQAHKEHIKKRYTSKQISKMIKETQRSRVWIHELIKSL